MRPTKLLTYLAFAIVIVSCTSSKEVTQQHRSAEEVVDLITGIPAADTAENEWIYSQLVEMGPSGIHSLTNMLNAPGSGDDSRARYAVDGLTKYVSRPGAEQERAMVENALIQELRTNHSASVKIFLMDQLQLIGSNESLAVLQSFIGDDRLNDSAVHALRSIDTPQVHRALVDALPSTTGKNRIAVVKALGDMQVTTVADNLLSYASSDDVNTRNVTLYALAQSGQPEAEKILASHVGDNASHSLDAERYYLLYAKRLAGEGNTERSTAISRDILSGSFSSDAKSTALSILAANEGEEALDDLIVAAESRDKRLRSTALGLFGQNPGWEIPGHWISDRDELSSAVHADIIVMLGRSGRASVSELSPFLEDDDPAVRIAAAVAMVSQGREEALPLLLEALHMTHDPEEVAALKTVLLQLPTQPLVSAVAERLPSSSNSARITLVEILAERRASEHLDAVLNVLDGSDNEVRLAIFKSLERIAEPADLPRLITLAAETGNEDEREALGYAVVHVSKDIPESEGRSDAILQALDKTPDNQKPFLLEILPEIGGEEALNRIVAESENTNERVRQAALSALSDWPDAAALTPLLEAFEHLPVETRGQVLESYLRLVQHSKYNAADKVRFLADILAETSSREEKITVIEAFGKLNSTEALQAVTPHFDDENEAVREESLRSAARILAASNGETDRALSLIEATTGTVNKEKIEQYIREERTGRGEENFTSLFNGEDLTGWIGDTDSYGVEDGQIISKEGGSGNIFTEQEYSDFNLRFEFKLSPGANNGLAIRSPLEGNPAYEAMELQILDNTAEKYSELEPYQYHGSVYGVAPAEQGYLKPAGEWNKQEVIADGSEITVRLNGHEILITDIKEAAASGTIDGREHPGLFRESGHIGFLGHGDKVAFRNIRIRDLNAYSPDYSLSSGNGDGINQPPEGFRKLFNGENLEGWKGLVGNPESRPEMSEQELAQKQKEANHAMRRHWSVRDGVLFFDGEGPSLVTEKKYKDFEMMVDWKIEPGGDSGVYLRGSPQVQIWDITEWPQGSGGLYNNQENPSDPLVPADNAIGEWNHMRIKMVGEKVTVHLNGELVVDNVVMENYWNRDKPIYPEEQIELQSHSTPLYFKNIFIREIPRKEQLFNGEDLTGWEPVGDNTGEWQAGDGLLYTEGGSGWLSTVETYDNFKLELEYRLPEGGNSGVFLRAPREGNPAYGGLEIQLLDDNAEEHSDLDPWQYTGSIYGVQAPSGRATKKAGEWQKMEITADGSDIKVQLNGEIIVNTSLIKFMDSVEEHPGLKRRSGYIGLQNHDTRVEFRNIRIKEIK